MIGRLARLNQRPISYEEASDAAYRINAYRYVETSAKVKDGLSDLFATAARASIAKEQSYKPEERKSRFFKKRFFFFGEKKSLVPTLLSPAQRRAPAAKKHECSMM